VPDLAPQIQQLIDHTGSAVEPVAVCSTWIAVVEWVDGEGNVWLEEYRPRDLPPWRRQGILYHILDNPDDLGDIDDE
jgi:hypothetical protein